jgi:hypothetical protein
MISELTVHREWPPECWKLHGRTQGGCMFFLCLPAFTESVGCHLALSSVHVSKGPDVYSILRTSRRVKQMSSTGGE